MTVIDKPKTSPDNSNDLTSRIEENVVPVTGDLAPGMTPSPSPSQGSSVVQKSSGSNPAGSSSTSPANNHNTPVNFTYLSSSIGGSKKGMKRRFSANELDDNDSSDTTLSKRSKHLELRPLKQPTKAIRLTVRPMLGEPFQVSMADDSYVCELKDMIAERTGLTLISVVLSIAANNQILNNDEQTLKEAGLTDGTVLSLTVKVSSGVETTVAYEEFESDFSGLDGEVIEFYEVVYPEDGKKGEPSETLAEFVKMMEGDKAKHHDELMDGPTFKPIDIVIPPGTTVTLSKILDQVRDDSPSLDSLKISSSDYSREKEDQYHEELLKAALGPRGAAIFQSPILSPVTPPVIESTMTGASSCAHCGKKCKLAMRFQCKCGKTFCSSHRYYDQHACTYDYKTADRIRVEAANPKVVKSKIDKL